MPNLTSYVAAPDDGYVQAKAGLIRKRAALAGEVEALNSQLLQKTADMRAIEAALRVLEPSIDTDGLPERQPVPLFKAFRGELARLLLTALRSAPDGLTTRELALGVICDRHMNPDDPSVLTLMQRRVAHSAQKMRDKGFVRSEVASGSGMLRWWVADCKPPAMLIAH